MTTAQILRDILAQKISRNSAFSLRAFARDLGVSHTYLSLVMNGKKSLSMKKVIHFSHLLELDERESQAFMQAGSREARGRAFEKAKSSPARSLPKAKRVENYFELERDRFMVLEEWYHLPILELTFLESFQSTPTWIAKQLHISVEQARTAVERLKRLHLLEEKNGKLVKTNEKLWLKSSRPDPRVRDYHRNMVSKAYDALDSIAPADIEAREFNSITIPIDPALLPEAKRRIAKFQRSLWELLSSGTPHELYQFNIQLFSLSRVPRRPSKKLTGKGVVLKRGKS